MTIHGSVADALLNHAIERVVHERLREHAAGAFGLGQFDELTFTGPPTVAEGGHDGEGGVGAGDVVAGEDRGDMRRVEVRIPAEQRVTHDGLEMDTERTCESVWSVGAIRRHPEHDDVLARLA